MWILNLRVISGLIVLTATIFVSTTTESKAGSETAEDFNAKERAALTQRREAEERANNFRQEKAEQANAAERIRQEASQLRAQEAANQARSAALKESRQAAATGPQVTGDIDGIQERAKRRRSLDEVHRDVIIALAVGTLVLVVIVIRGIFRSRNQTHGQRNTDVSSSEASQLQAAKNLYNDRVYDASEKAFRAILLNNPQNSDAYFFLGLISLNKGAINDAQLSLRRAIALNNGHVDAIFWLSEVLSKDSREHDAALSGFQRVIQLRPDHRLARSRVQAMGGVLPAEVAPYDHDGPVDRSVISDPESVYAGDMYDEIRERAKLVEIGQGPNRYAIAVRQIIDSRISSRHPFISAFFQELVLHAIFIIAICFGAYALDAFGRSLETDGVKIGNTLSQASTMVVPVVFFYFTYIAILIIRIQSMAVGIDRGFILVTGGRVFKNNSLIVDIYKVDKFGVEQDFLNMLTGDGMLIIDTGEHRMRIKGIAKFAELKSLAIKLRALRITLRSLDLDKGIMN